MSLKLDLKMIMRSIKHTFNVHQSEVSGFTLEKDKHNKKDQDQDSDGLKNYFKLQ